MQNGSQDLICQDNERVGRWVAEGFKGQFCEGSTAIGIEKDGVLKAGVMYDAYTGVNGSISSHFRCDDPKVITKLFYQIVFDFPFNVAKVKRITNLVNEKNLHSRDITERLGFAQETIIKDYFPDGDAIIYRMYRHECRWLTAKWRRYEQEISPT